MNTHIADVLHVQREKNGNRSIFVNEIGPLVIYANICAFCLC